MSSYLSNLLNTVLSTDVASSPTEIADFLSQVRQSTDRRQLDGLRDELIALYRDSGTDWVDLLDEHEVNAIYTSQVEAKRFVIENIWNVLFDDPIDRAPAI